MIIYGQRIVDGTKEMYIYFLLKYTKYYPYKIFPLYEIMDDNEQQLIKCNICKKNNNVIPKEGYNFTGQRGNASLNLFEGEYFHCNYCNSYNENSDDIHQFNKQKLFVFSQMYIFIDELYKIKNNKIEKYYISPKKYKYKIIWSKNIIKVNTQINNALI